MRIGRRRGSRFAREVRRRNGQRPCFGKQLECDGVIRNSHRHGSVRFTEVPRQRWLGFHNEREPAGPKSLGEFFCDCGQVHRKPRQCRGARNQHRRWRSTAATLGCQQRGDGRRRESVGSDSVDSVSWQNNELAVSNCGARATHPLQQLLWVSGVEYRAHFLDASLRTGVFPMGCRAGFPAIVANEVPLCSDPDRACPDEWRQHAIHSPEAMRRFQLLDARRVPWRVGRRHATASVQHRRECG